jgi:hypothetical protein
VHLAEIWRYPVKSLAGERLQDAELRMDGIAGDRLVSVVLGGRVVTSRIRPRLLGLRGSTAPDGTPLVDGVPWRDSAALAAVRAATSLPEAELVADDSLERFDVLPLMVATDGAGADIGLDLRRFRPNLVIGGVEGLGRAALAGPDAEDRRRQRLRVRREAAPAVRDDDFRPGHPGAGPHRSAAPRRRLRRGLRARLLRGEARRDPRGRHGRAATRLRPPGGMSQPHSNQGRTPRL